MDVGGCLLTPKESVGDTYLRLARAHGFGPEVTRASVKAAVARGSRRRLPGASAGVRYVGDGKSFWRPLVAAAMGNLAMDDPRLEPVLDDLYAHYENPDAWHVAPGAAEALAALREGAFASPWCPTGTNGFRNCSGIAGSTSARWTRWWCPRRCCRISRTGAFDAALRRLGMSPEEAGAVAHVGDSVVNDVEGARAAGFGAALLWSSKDEKGMRAFDFAELAEDILATRE